MDENPDLKLLRAYEPQLRFTTAERFRPMAVEPYVRQCSLWLEYRLLGLFTSHVLVNTEGEYDTDSLPPDLDDWQPAPDKRPPWWNWPFVSRHPYLRYVQQKHLDAQRKPDQGPDNSLANWSLGTLGCLVFPILPVLLLLNALFKPPPVTLALLVAGLVLWALSGAFIERARGLALALIGFGYAAISFAVLHWIGWTTLAGATAALFVAQGLSSAILNADQVVDWFSSLDNETAGAAAERIQESAAQCDHAPPCYHYYGRVFRPQGRSQWRAVLQYWFFYPMNDWRTGPDRGVDDHEGDWEGVQIFLPKDRSKQALVAYSQHLGNEVRPLDGRHPTVYVARGSHANYSAPGEHALTDMILGKLLRNPRAIARAIAALLASLGGYGRRLPSQAGDDLRQLGRQIRGDGSADLLSSVQQHLQASVSENVPGSVDRALGDGRRIEPGQWTPMLIDASTPWVQFRGLWGRKVGFGGESGPGGPMYSQSGRVRPAWRDPIGWAGLGP